MVEHAVWDREAVRSYLTTPTISLYAFCKLVRTLGTGWTVFVSGGGFDSRSVRRFYCQVAQLVEHFVLLFMLCQKCGKVFGTRAFVDGKYRTLNRRKYCLACSPFGSHNTRRLVLDINVPARTCAWCDRVFIPSRANQQFCRTGCKSKFFVSEYRRKTKLKAIAYLGGKCSQCGYDKCVDALHFHHRNPSNKDFSISRRGHCTAWSRVVREIRKCVLLCANCHAEHHSLARSSTVERHTVNVDVGGSIPPVPAILSAQDVVV